MGFRADVPRDLNHGNLAQDLSCEKQGLPKVKPAEAIPQGIWEECTTQKAPCLQPPSGVETSGGQGHVPRVTSTAWGVVSRGLDQSPLRDTLSSQQQLFHSPNCAFLPPDPESQRKRTVQNVLDLRQNLEETMSSLRGSQVTHR